MSTTFLPCGDYHQNYTEDHSWWQTKFIKGKMILLFLILFIGIPQVADVRSSVAASFVKPDAANKTIHIRLELNPNLDGIGIVLRWDGRDGSIIPDGTRTVLLRVSRS